MYEVRIADNFHYMDPDEVVGHGTYTTWEAALAAAKAIVDESLSELREPGMSGQELYSRYIQFGDDPFILGDPPAGADFSAWGYARACCHVGDDANDASSSPVESGAAGDSPPLHRSEPAHAPRTVPPAAPLPPSHRAGLFARLCRAVHPPRRR